jgi:hypothetical protein
VNIISHLGGRNLSRSKMSNIYKYRVLSLISCLLSCLLADAIFYCGNVNLTLGAMHGKEICYAQAGKNIEFV